VAFAGKEMNDDLTLIMCESVGLEFLIYKVQYLVRILFGFKRLFWEHILMKSLCLLITPRIFK
jgi:hypothetical protein